MDQAKNSAKELKQNVKQDNAKQMGFKEAKMHEKLRNTLRKRGKHSDEIAEKVKKLMNMDD